MVQDVVRQWNMPSSTNAAKTYTVRMYADASFSCNCPRWTFKRAGQPRACPHIIAIQSVLRLESLGPVPKPGTETPKRRIRILGGPK